MMKERAELRMNLRIDDLYSALEGLEALHVELGEVLRRKLEWIRASDTARMHACGVDEQRLLTRIAEQEQRRRIAMEEIGRAFGIDAARARTMKARELATRVTEPRRVRLLQLSDRLRTVVSDVERVNRMVGQVSAQVLEHLRVLFESVAASDEPAGGYTDRGRTAKQTRRELFEIYG